MKNISFDKSIRHSDSRIFKNKFIFNVPMHYFCYYTEYIVGTNRYFNPYQ